MNPHSTEIIQILSASSAKYAEKQRYMYISLKSVVLSWRNVAAILEVLLPGHVASRTRKLHVHFRFIYKQVGGKDGACREPTVTRG